jgi:arylsulfatase A-like enzyme
MMLAGLRQHATEATGSRIVRGKAMKSKPSILIFFTDQQRWDTVGAYGSPMGLTPNLDAAARRGVRFENAFTNQPVCSPARACLLTGQYGTTHGVWHNAVGLECKNTLAHCLHRAGYETGYVGKWHLAPRESDGLASPVPPDYRGGFIDFWEASNSLEHTSQPYDTTVYDSDGNPIRIQDRYRADVMADRAIRFIQRDHDRPFLLMVSILEPHQQNDMHRMVAPEGYADTYKNPFVPHDLRPFPGDWQEQLPDYYGCVARIDECFGRVTAALEEKGLLENTIVLFLSDHGCHFRTRNAEYKRSCHESSVRIPFVMSGPGFNRSLVVPELVSLVDVAPTLLDAVGVPIPGQMQGRSAMPLLDRRIDGWENEVFIQISEASVSRAIRNERWKYCVAAPDADRATDPSSASYVDYQMYDLFADPYELVNLVGRVPYRKAADELRERLKARMVQAGEHEPEIRAAVLL